MKNGTIGPEPGQIIPAGYCVKCRGCCRFHQQEGPWLPHLLDSEEGRLGHLRIVPAPPAPPDMPPWTEPPFKCSELENTANTCGVYAERPFECRLYPFVLAREGGAFFLAVDENCPYVRDEGGTEAFAAFARKLSRTLQEAGWKAVLRDNCHLFQRYPGVRMITELAL